MTKASKRERKKERIKLTSSQSGRSCEREESSSLWELVSVSGDNRGASDQIRRVSPLKDAAYFDSSVYRHISGSTWLSQKMLLLPLLLLFCCPIVSHHKLISTLPTCVSFPFLSMYRSLLLLLLLPLLLLLLPLPAELKQHHLNSRRIDFFASLFDFLSTFASQLPSPRH